MEKFYRIDSTRASVLEYIWWHKSPLVIIPLMMKWLRVATPCSSDDPNTESTRPFVVESLPSDIAASFAPLTEQFTGLGFIDPVFHVIADPGTRATIYWATFRHESGNYFARIHRRIWQQTANPNRALFPLFFTAFTDGTFLVSSSGKPDMAAPKTVQMNRMPGAATGPLWAKHQRLSDQLAGQKTIAPVNSPEDLLAVTEQFHVLVRDFHLARGVFRERSVAEQGCMDAFAARLAEAEASGVEHAAVLAELDRLQDAKSSWRGSLWFLAGSLVVFLALGAARWNWQYTLWLIPVLFFHECGHWAAMRVFHYRNLRMFFIPLFGAAVTGQNWNVPGWKKALVSLAGPLPGIALGVFLGVVGLVLHKMWLDSAALLLLFLNGFNLLPFLPMDGGHVLHATLFCRNRWLDVTFRILATVGLFLLGAFGLGRFFTFLAILMAINLRSAFRLAKVTDKLRKAGLPPPLPGEDRIPVPTAQAIISALKAEPPVMNNRVLAQNTVNIYETLNAHPPGVLATIGLLTLQGGAFLVAVVMGLLVFAAKNPSVLEAFDAGLTGPKHRFQAGDWQTWTGAETREHPSAVRNLVVATFKNHAKAKMAFATLVSQTPTNATITWFGDSVLLALPVEDDAGRNREFDQLQLLTTNLFVALSNQPVVVNLNFLAPTAADATNIVRDLNNYLGAGVGLHLIAPWSLEARAPDFSTYNHARQEWHRINEDIGNIADDAAVEAYAKKISVAIKRGDEAQRSQLLEAQKQARADAVAREIQNLRSDPTNPVDGVLLDLQARLTELNDTNREGRAAIYRELAPKLGRVKFAGDVPAPGADDAGAGTGTVTQHRLLVEVSWMSLNDAPTSLPLLCNWLASQKCKLMRYDFAGSWALSDSDDGD